jgi:hypothetical protein
MSSGHRFLFTTLPTNDLGLVTRALPIAHELRAHGQEVIFSSPAKAPRLLVEAAGFENLVPQHPIYDFIDVEHSLAGLSRFVASRPWKIRKLSLWQYLRDVIPALPLRSVPKVDGEVWDRDHASAMMGMLNEGFVSANCEAFRKVIGHSRPDVIVDCWNPFAVIAARALGKPVITIIQANAHPQSSGFIWWKTPPSQIPTPVDVINLVLQDYGLNRIQKLADLNVGDLTLVVGTPETDPLPNVNGAEYLGAVLWQKGGAQLPSWIDHCAKNKPLIWV